MVRIPGSWSSFDQIEVELTLDELMLLYSTSNEIVTADRRFAASLKGLDLGNDTSAPSEGQEVSSFEDVQQRARAKVAGVSEDEIAFQDIGLGFVVEGE